MGRPGATRSRSAAQRDPGASRLVDVEPGVYAGLPMVGGPVGHVPPAAAHLTAGGRDCRPLRQGNEETCTRTSPDTGRWYIMLHGYVAYADVTLTATVR